MPRPVLHAHKDGWATALDHPKAVVIDYQNKILRQGTEKLDLFKRPQQFKFMCFMLRGADLFHARKAIAQAVYENVDVPDHYVSQLVTNALPFVSWLGMTFETAKALGVRLHSEPRETLECTIAPSQQPPTRWKSHDDELQTCLRKLSRSSRISNGNAWKHTKRRPRLLESTDPLTLISNGPAIS